ncbi:hypothetical protein CHU92_05220 [Flavobacterium cyanobacteriorum]|uniref:Outer membrane protein beta-barrel domain-containing protein n=1 Tax=Flavobacterium cyanobacteriorum TaxID=2022802 RepID=A0A255ZC01_9FLAO|nr:hypothetical protein CHU92_05220 [Flavobacterium cyanobacteriorum]
MSFFFFLISFQFKAQTITGIISDKKSGVDNVFVTIRKVTSPNLIYQFTTTNKDGFYEINLKSKQDSLIIDVNAVDYEPTQKTLYNVQDRSSHKVDFILEQRITELKEVVIEHKQSIVVRNDTVTYNPDSFKDGTERVVEDLLKKMPGIKVEKNGEIKYKGKSIKKLLLDGDDLFDLQYTIGSRNINSEIIDKVQAVENFNDNPLLKNLINSDDVALNLVLKKGKFDISGNAEAGYGFRDKYDLSATGLVINRKIKGFSIGTFNNIGNNMSPYDFTSEIVSTGHDGDKTYLTPQLLYQGNFYSDLDEGYHRINNSLYLNSNFLYKFSDRTSSKVNVGVYDDKISRRNSRLSIYSFNNESFQVSESEILKKKPRLYNVNWQVLHKSADSLMWEYLGKINYEDIDFRSQSVNNQINQSNKVKTTNIFLKQNLIFTKRISPNSAFTGYSHFSKSSSPQEYLLSPGTSLFNDNSTIIENRQSARFDKEYLVLNFQYFIKSKNTRLLFKGGYKMNSNDFESRLYEIAGNGEERTSLNFQNDLQYNIMMPYFGSSYSYAKKKFAFTAGLSAQYYKFKLFNHSQGKYNKENDLIFIPAADVRYFFNRKSSLSARYSFSQTAPEEKNIFGGFVLNDYRSFVNNEVDVTFLKTHSYLLNYSFNDFYNLTTFQISLGHNYRINDYFVRNIINSNISASTFFQLDVGNKNYNININGEKYFHFMRTTLQINVNYSISQSKNVVNESNLRDVENKVAFFDITGRTGLRGMFDFENKTSFIHITSLLGDATQNKFSTLSNSLKSILKIRSNIKANATLNFIMPDLSINNNYWFLDTELRYTSANKKVEYSLIGRNLTNNKNFTTISITDYARSVSSHNLVERFIMLKCSFNF